MNGRVTRRVAWVLAFAAGAWGPGCGDDDVNGASDAGGSGTDASADASSTDASTDASSDGGTMGFDLCPLDAPNREEMQAPCCFRVSGEEKLEGPEFRVANLTIMDPAGLLIANGLLPTNIENEVVNWLIDIDVDGSEVAIGTGIGSRNADGSMTLGLPDYPPVRLTGTIEGETIRSTGPAEDTLVVPLFEADGETVIVNLIVRNLTFTATMSENRSCIGARQRQLPGSWDARDGLLEGFMALEDAMAEELTFGPLNDTTLCMLLKGDGTPPGERCDLSERADWSTPPDAFCDGQTPETCSAEEGVCDPRVDCNAWSLRTAFAAYGVEITE